MTDIMKSIEEACDCSRQIGITEAGRAHGNFTKDDSRFLTAMQQSKAKHVAALQAAIEALQAEIERYKTQWTEWSDSLDSVMKQRNALQGEVERLKSDIQTHQRSFAALKSDIEEVKCFWKEAQRMNRELQAKLTAMEAQEKIAQSTFNARSIAEHAVAIANVATANQERTESLLIDGKEYTVPAQVAIEILRLHLENRGAIQERDAIYDLMDSKHPRRWSR